MFKSKLNELLTSETYEYSDLNKELFKNNSDLISLVLKACIVEKYENIAMFF